MDGTIDRRPMVLTLKFSRESCWFYAPWSKWTAVPLSLARPLGSKPLPIFFAVAISWVLGEWRFLACIYHRFSHDFELQDGRLILLGTILWLSNFELGHHNQPHTLNISAFCEGYISYILYFRANPSAEGHFTLACNSKRLTNRRWFSQIACHWHHILGATFVWINTK